LTTRGNYAKLKSTIRAISSHPSLELQIIVAGGITLSRYGDYSSHIEGDGFTINEKIPFLFAGDSLEAMTMSAGIATMELGRAFERLKPEIVLVIADRYEALSVAHAALCSNKIIAHLEGGEISGSIDERIRHAITKLSHIHFPANYESAGRIERMGEPINSIFTVGTPSLDLISSIELENIEHLTRFQSKYGKGDLIDLNKDYLVVSQHSLVTESMSYGQQIQDTLGALNEIGLPVVWVLPNMDAGESSALEVLNNRDKAGVPIMVFASLPMELYAPLIYNSKCLVGNSSSGLREGEYLGVPVINIGNRQKGRLRGKNVIDVEHSVISISYAIRKQLAHGRYKTEYLYGDGNSGKKIAEILATFKVDLDKRITY
jgi:UDP-hydrolysing UDP-N-acetyl-D-glucosamine 2-epimerase